LGATAIGVVPDFKDFQLDAEPSPEVYTGYAMAPVIRSIRVVIRTSVDPKSLALPLRKMISNIDKDVPVFQLQSLEQELSNSIAPRRFNLALLAAFAGTAVLLALIGIYGVIAYLVTQRTPEIGIRMALGARRREIVRLVLAQGMEMVLIGILVGAVSSLALMRLMAAMLYSVKPGDPGTFAAVAVLLAATALLACFVPAMRSALIDPLTALRHD
jgi:putative ABC transport system permease protein